MEDKRRGIQYAKGKDSSFLVNREGEKYLTNEGYEVKIIEYFNATNCTIQFNDERQTILKNIRMGALRTGCVKNPYRPCICGIGYFGIGKYKAKINRITTIKYNKWKDMIERCYSKVQHQKHPSYKGCSVIDGWHNFQVFAEWFEENYKKGFALDKDLLIKGNRVYSPETCCLVPQEVNNLFVKRGKHKNGLPRCIRISGKKYEGVIRINGDVIPLGKFDTIEEAFQAYKVAKETHIKEVADKWQPFIEPKVYQAMYNWVVEITD